MSRIRSRDTGPEREYAASHRILADHPRLPFNPDFISPEGIVFVDSGFWHGQVARRTFDRLAPKWQDKLVRNLARDLSADSFYRICGVKAVRR